MGKNYVFGTIFAVVWLIQQVNSVIIVPAPTIVIESATSRNIIVNWTMPIKELYDNFTVEVHAPGEDVRMMVLNATRLEVIDLTPGALYTFFVNAHRGNLTSDTSVIMQDTVPLPPTNLKLETFQSLILSMEGVFGEVEFTLDVPGIEAVWEGPEVGICDCYVAAISPPDGRLARPAQNIRVMPTCQETVCQAPPNATTSLPPRKPVNFICKSMSNLLQLN